MRQDSWSVAAPLDAAVATGGNITFNCAASPVTITIMNHNLVARTSISGGIYSSGTLTVTNAGIFAFAQ